jgi:ribosomal protein S24E
MICAFPFSESAVIDFLLDEQQTNRNNYKTRSCGAGKIEGERAIYVRTESVANVIHLYILKRLTINVYVYVSHRFCFVPYPYLWA